VIHGRACPVCGEADRKLMYEQRFDQISGAKLLDGYDIVVCTACGTGFADGIPEQPVFDEYYRELSKYEGSGPGESAPPVESRFEELAELMAPFIQRPDARILEIGCGYGQLLWLLRQRGFTSVLGADPSPGCARAARRFYDVDMIASTVFTVPEPAEPYDFLILTGVIEHIRDLDRTVEKFHKLLGPEGRVCLQVPDASRFEPGLDAPFQEFSTEHINYFSPDSMNNLMTQRGFRVVESGRAVRALHEASVRTAWGVYEKSAVRTPLERDVETEAGLAAYIGGCRSQDAEVRVKIQRALPPDGRIIVWGVGAHTLRLLATSGLDPQWIAAFVDSNAKYQQRELRGIPVISPEDVRLRAEPILISSKGFQNEIHDQITHRMGLPNPVILLYESQAAKA
jgi:SAM-dependent methyltransferase